MPDAAGCVGGQEVVNDPGKLRDISWSLGLETYSRHIFPYADQSEPKCCSKAQGLESWEFLKARLKGLGLAHGFGAVYRSKVNLFARMLPGSYIRGLPRGRLISLLHSRGPGTNYPGTPHRRAYPCSLRFCAEPAGRPVYFSN